MASAKLWLQLVYGFGLAIAQLRFDFGSAMSFLSYVFCIAMASACLWLQLSNFGIPEKTFKNLGELSVTKEVH